MISLQKARDAAHAAVIAQRGAASSMVQLNPGAPKQASFVFRADLGAGGHIVVKIGDPRRIALAAARLTAVYPAMCDGRFRVPQLLAHDADGGVLVMEDARGQSAHDLFLSGPAGAARSLAAAGAWIARFHRPTRHMGAFNPDPHLNWLQKQVAAHRAGARVIADFDRFEAALSELQHACDAARGQPVLRCITHRDYHLRNLLVRNLGRTYGIDFENAKRDEALRDLLFFAADAAKIAPAPPTANALRGVATSLRTAYNRPLGAKISRQVVQAAFALSGWASLDMAQSALGPNRTRALAVMQLIATTDDLFADP